MAVNIPFGDAVNNPSEQLEVCRDPEGGHKRGVRTKGFTLIELLVVLAIVSMLLSLAVPRYFQSIENAKTTVLADNLRQTRATLDKFFSDTGRYPESLDELIEKGYLKSLPFDPVADSSNTWVIVAPKEGNKGRVFDIRSSAPGSDRFGRPLSEL